MWWKGADVMANVKKTQYEELSEDQIATARRRRSRARCSLLVIVMAFWQMRGQHPSCRQMFVRVRCSGAMFRQHRCR